MSKTYTFEDPYFTVEVPVTTAVCAVAAVWCTYHAIRGDFLTPALLAFFVVAGIYQVWNVVVSAAYPHHVIVDDEYLDPDTGRLDLKRADLITYCHGQYYTLGEQLGHFGWTVRKRKEK